MTEEERLREAYAEILEVLKKYKVHWAAAEADEMWLEVDNQEDRVIH
jgi:hypothetical protein